MSRLNVFSLRTSTQPTFTRTFTDPEQPGASLQITLKRPLPPEVATIFDRMDELVAEWVEGRDGEPPNAFPVPGGKAIMLSRRMCYMLALLETMQVPGEDEAPYTIPELVYLSIAMPSAWNELVLFAEESRYGMGEPDPTAGSTEESSAP